MTEHVPEAVFAALLAVQDLDTAMAQAEHRKAALPERQDLVAAQGARQALTARLEELSAEETSLRAARDQLDEQASTLSTRRATIQERMYSARGSSGRDLAAMDEEVRHLAERQRALEDRELEVMEVLEPLDATMAELRDDLQRVEATVAERQAATATAEAVVDEALANLAGRRQEAAAQLPAALAARYERLRARLGGVGAARLVGDHCDGCHLTLSSAEIDRIRHQDPGSVATCEQCGRILVVPPPDAAGTGH